MAAGRPAVCTAVGGIPEMIDDGVTGYLVRPRDPVALADRLIRILRDPELGHAMGKAARVRVESEFSLTRSVSSTEAALQSLVGTRPNRTAPVRLAAVLDETHVGGAEVLLLNMFRYFDPRMVVPRLVCLRAAGPLADEFRAAGFDVEVLDRTGRFDMRTVPRLIRSFRTNRTDAVLVNHHHRAALALGRLAARLAGTPVNVVAAHDMDLTSVGKRVLPNWAVNTLACSDGLVLLSEGQGDYLRREEGVGRGWLGTTREFVVPNGITLPEPPTAEQRASARAQMGLSEADFAVGIVARLSAQKAHEVLFEAVAACVEDVPHIRLVVVGGGTRDTELRLLADELGISARTTFLGVRRDVVELAPGFDVACLSSVHEGVPITLIEAMAAALPIVATDCGSVRDLVTDGEHGFVVPVGDVEGYARRLRELARDDVLRARLGARGRQHAEQNFRIEHTARRYEELLHELCGGR
jgi:glycosyltransferase involved in cell wall biosynthesis